MIAVTGPSGPSPAPSPAASAAAYASPGYSWYQSMMSARYGSVTSMSNEDCIAALL